MKIKRGIKLLSVIVLLIIVASSMTSCLLLAGTEGAGLTRADIEAMIQNKLTGESVVIGGDTNNITINTTGGESLVVASKAILSAVSVYCKFERQYTSGFYPNTQTQTKEYTSAGSGVIYKLDKGSGDAYVITNYHVVYDANSNTTNRISEDISLYLYGQEAPAYAIPATYIGGSMKYDIAVLKVEDSAVLAASNAVEADIESSDSIAPLETVIAVGNPEMKGLSVTVGHVNVDSEDISITGADNVTSITMRVIRIDTPVNSGNSGGGLFNSKGELVGIVNAKVLDSNIENIGYAIPSNIAKNIADNIIYYCDGKDEESVYRCVMGVKPGVGARSTVYDENTGIITKLELIGISEVTEGSVADGKLFAGDKINSITVDGVKVEVTRLHHVFDTMLTARAGSTVTVNVTRNGESFDVTLTMTEDCLVKEI